MASGNFRPVITNVIDNYGPTQGDVLNIANASAPALDTTDDNLPTIVGTAEPNTSLTLSINNRDTFTTVSDNNWQWSIDVGPLPAGLYTFVASQPIDNSSFSTSSNSYAIYNSHVLTPTITRVTDAAGTNIPNGGETTISTTLPTLHGTAEPWSLLQIFDNGQKIGEIKTSVDTFYSWNWNFTPTTPLQSGVTHQFTVLASSALYGSTADVTPSEGSYNIGIGVATTLPAPLAPVITSVLDDVGTNQGAVADGGQTNDVRPTLHGTSEPGTVVTVSDNGHVIGTATTGADWQWTFTPGADLTAGTNTLSVTAARPDNAGSSTAAWYTHVLDVTPSLDAVLAGAGLSAAPAAAAPTAQAAYVSPSVHTAAVDTLHHDLAY